jgi:subfamily B ATP-binding cassette protein MsbA
MAKPGVKLYGRVLKYVLPFWGVVITAALGNILCAGADSYATYLFKPLLDKGFIEKNVHFLTALPIIIIGIFVIRGVGNFLSTFYMGFLSKKIVMVLRQEMFAHIMHLPAKFFDQAASARLLSKLTYNVDQIIQATGVTFRILVQQSFFLLGLITVMLITNWHLTLLIFLVLPFLVSFVRFVSQRFRKLSRRIQNAMGNVMHSAEESIVGYREVRIFGGEAQQIRQFDQSVTYNFVQEMKVTLTDALSSPIIQIFCSMLLALVIYFAVRPPAMSPGSFVAMLTAMLASFKPIRDLSQVNSSIQRGLAAAEGIFELLDEEPEQDHGTQELAEISGHIRLENLNFHYQSNATPVLQDINLDIPAGKTVAFVGRSGSGKTTLISLLTRFYDVHADEGAIYLDQVNIQDLKLKNLRQHFAMVSQHVCLFDDTIYHNIAYGDSENASEADVIKACLLYTSPSPRDH